MNGTIHSIYNSIITGMTFTYTTFLTYVRSFSFKKNMLVRHMIKFFVTRSKVKDSFWPIKAKFFKNEASFQWFCANSLTIQSNKIIILSRIAICLFSQVVFHTLHFKQFTYNKSGFYRESKEKWKINMQTISVL